MNTVIRPLENCLPVSDLSLTLINFGVQPKDPTHKYGPILRSEYILQYITDGNGYLEISGKKYYLKVGDMFCLPKNVLHKYWANAKNPYTYYWIGIDGIDAKKILESAGFTDKNPVIYYGDAQITQIFELIKDALLEKNFVGYVQAQSQVYQLLAYLLKQRQSNLVKLENETMRIVSQTIEYIHNNYNDDITVSKMAKRVGLCRNYLSVIFKKTMGVSPVEYLLSYRISKAQIMLKQKATVTETAISCGFNSINNFSVQFKRLVGVSPYAFKISGL